MSIKVSQFEKLLLQLQNLAVNSDKLGMKQLHLKALSGFKKIVGRVSIAGLLVTTGCGIEASLTDLVSAIDPGATMNRTEPDITYGETVTTSSGTPGYVIKASFGETGDQQTLSNGWQVEGFLYE